MPNPNIRTFGRLNKKKMLVPVTLYDTALNSAAYGNTAVMGDLFNDIMGAVVPQWDNRPDWMKKLVVKPDPAKIAGAAIKAVPPSQVGKVMNVADKYGMNFFYNTPAGQMPINAQTAESLYGNFPAMLRMKDLASGIPSWLIMAGGVGLFVLIFMQAKKR